MERADICIETVVNTIFFQTAAFSSHAMIAFLTYVVLLMTKVMLGKSLEEKADKAVLT